MIKLIVYGNPHKHGLTSALTALASWAGRQGAKLCVARDLADVLPGDQALGVMPDGAMLEIYEGLNHHDSPSIAPEDRALLVCLGGDGTLLHAVRRFWPLPAPVLSVNLGSLGFNSSVEPEHLADALDDWLAGRCPVSDRMTLSVRWLRGPEVLAETVAVNDVVLLKQHEARMIHLSLRQGEALISSFAADGLIVATPTGSTAYNLSAGGPIIYPGLQVMVATAICPHTLASRPVVLPPDPAVEFEFSDRHGSSQANLWVDGQERWPIAEGDRIAVAAARQPLRLISGGAAQYFSKLHRKLCWGGELEYRESDR